jgi:4a-hydroxytetrahydrobiopterin dehydratase
MTTLSDDDITAALAGLPGWERVGDAITREYRFSRFPDAVAFVVRIAYDAEAADHHPDLDIRYNRVRVTLSTHSEGGVTAKDVDLARVIESLGP